jgi:hypothetical protein
VQTSTGQPPLSLLQSNVLSIAPMAGENIVKIIKNGKRENQ